MALKVLLLHEDIRPPGQGGGAESLVRDLMSGVAQRGVEMEWWTGHDKPLYKAIEDFQPDIAHVMTIHVSLDMPWIISYLHQCGIPVVWHIQDYWPTCGPRMLMIGDKSCPAVKGVCDLSCRAKPAPREWRDIVNSTFVVSGNEYTAEIYRRNGLRVDAVVELGVPLDIFHPDHSKRTATRIMTSTAWPDAPWKGMHMILRVTRESDHAVRLVTGETREVLADYLQQSSIYVFPSLYEETFALSLCDAMASGCACIAADVAGSKAQIVHGETGLLYPRQDHLTLRKYLDLLVKDHGLRECLGNNAAEHVAQDHSNTAMADRWIKVYNQVIKRTIKL